MKTANIDLDGVVYPFHEIMAMYTWQKRGGNPYAEFKYQWDFDNELPYPAPDRWDFMDDWQLVPKQFDSLFRLGVDEGVIWTQGAPIRGSVDALWELDQHGFYIRIVTQRLVHKNSHSQVQAATAEWLDKWNVPYHELVYMGKGSSKADFKADFALDDRPHNVIQMNMAESADAYLLDRPWNQDFETDQRLFDWISFVNIATGVYDGLSSWEMDQDDAVQADSPDTQGVSGDN